MAISTPSAAPATEQQETSSCVEPLHRLPSGRSVVVKVAEDCEQLEIRDAAGRVEVWVILTAEGPVVRISGARLELASADTIALQCRRFEVETAESASIKSKGDVQITGRELKVRTSEDIHLNGEFIRLNC
jgi:hypothetical protein